MPRSSSSKEINKRRPLTLYKGLDVPRGREKDRHLDREDRNDGESRYRAVLGPCLRGSNTYG